MTAHLVKICGGQYEQFVLPLGGALETTWAKDKLAETGCWAVIRDPRNAEQKKACAGTPKAR
eukprot:5171005-Karenia_brevis.AAC.1